MRDLGIVFLSVLIAVLLVKTGVIRNMLLSLFGSKIIASFVAGIFFVSVFTAAPATVVLAQLAHPDSALLVAFFASLGALLGDLIIFHFIEDSFSADLVDFLKHSRLKKFSFLFKLGPLRWLFAVLGAAIIASPLPDDFGLVLMGISKMKSSLFIPLFLGMNFLGVYLIGHYF